MLGSLRAIFQGRPLPSAISFSVAP